MIPSILKKEKVQALIVVLSLIVLAIIMQIGSLKIVTRISDNTLSHLISAFNIQDSIIDETLQGETTKVITLKKQYLISNQIKNYYQKLGIKYYQNYYSFSTCSIVFITLSTIAVFLIASEGWKNAKLVTKSFFITTIALSSYYYFLPNVFSNKDNIKKNMDNVVVYQKIQSDILSVYNQISNFDDIKLDSIISKNYNDISSNLEFNSTIDDSSLKSEFNTLVKNLNQKKQ